MHIQDAQDRNWTLYWDDTWTLRRLGYENLLKTKLQIAIRNLLKKLKPPKLK